MGWGIDFKADIFLSRMDFGNNILQVEDKIEDVKSDIASIKNTLSMYAACNPKDLTPEEWKEDGINFLKMRVDELFEEYEQNINLLHNLSLYLEYLKEQEK